jgi:Lar family restriction alleviation protein
MSDKIEQLKPCPFCGTTPVHAEKGVYNSVICPKCGVETGGFFYDSEEPVKKAIEEWNTRPIEDALRIELDKADGAGVELEAENEKLRAALTAVNNGKLKTLNKETISTVLLRALELWPAVSVGCLVEIVWNSDKYLEDLQRGGEIPDPLEY